MANVNYVKQVSVKNESGSLDSAYSIGAGFADVVDTRADRGNYTLEQFFDNYINFMRNTTFVYTGTTQPSNTHVGIWIDTSVTNGLS